jgi:hypothetical protein
MSQRRFLIYLLIISALLSYLTYYGPFQKYFWKEETPVAVTMPAVPMSEIVIDFSSPEALSEWKPHSFEKNTLYEIIDNGTERFLKATSDKTSSALFHEVNLEMRTKPSFVWRWRVQKFVSGKKNEKFLDKNENDFTARIYAVFEGRNRLSHDVIQYVWDDHFPAGTFTDNSSLNRIKVVVVRSGPAPTDGWVEERRDLTKDYETFYGKSPADKRLLIMGLMSDSDDTKSQSEAWFKDFRFEFPAGMALKPAPDKKENPVKASLSFFSKISSKTKDFGEAVLETTTTLGGILPSKDEAEDLKNDGL